VQCGKQTSMIGVGVGVVGDPAPGSSPRESDKRSEVQVGGLGGWGARGGGGGGGGKGADPGSGACFAL
jgi:hypothetical protein